MTTRDIRDDLRERLAGIPRVREELHAKIAALDEYEAQLKGLLKIEEQMAVNDAKPPSARQPLVTRRTAQPVEEEADDAEETEESQEGLSQEFEADILSILSDGEDWEHARIKEEMETKGWTEGAVSMGRQIHGTLLALRHRGLVESLGSGMWRKTEPET
jgi:hypothetical protein